MCTFPVPTDHDVFQQYTSLVKKLTQLSEKRVQLIQLSSSVNSGLGDLAIRIVNADSHPLVQSLREGAHSAALELDEVVTNMIISEGAHSAVLELDEVVIIITNTIISGHACQKLEEHIKL